jgi:diadenosine tetraphosphate (Ap4A) HIT family hydrolase
MAYDKENVFAKIIRGQIPCKKAYEDDHALAFHDVNPQTPIHVLVVPKGSYTSFDDFSQYASDQEIVAFVRAVGKVASELQVSKAGYRILANHGADAHQEVAHFHMHIFAGRDLGRMIGPG